MTTTVNLLIADDHSVVRAGLRALLERQGRFRVIAEAGTGEEAIAKVPGFNAERARKLLETLAANASV